MFVLGISGKLGVGKNYVSENMIIPMILKWYKNKVVVPYFFSFGSFIKSELYGRDDRLTYHNLFEEKTSDIRHRLQQYGTEIGRDNFRKDIWIRQVKLWMEIQTNQLNVINQHLSTPIYPMFVIQDIRFPNELEFIQSFENSLVIRIEAPLRHLQKCREEQSTPQSHSSETSLDNILCENIIYNDETDTDIHQQINDILYKCLKDTD